VQLGQERRAALVPSGQALRWRLAVDLGLDGVERADARHGLARDRAVGGEQHVVEFAPRMRPAGRLDHLAALVERGEAGIAVGLQEAREALEMRARVAMAAVRMTAADQAGLGVSVDAGRKGDDEAGGA